MSPIGLTAAELEHCARLGLDPLVYLGARQGRRAEVDVGAMLGVDPQEYEAQRLREHVGALEAGAAAAATAMPVVNVRGVGLTAAELELCAAIGIAPEAYAEQRARENRWP